MLRQKITSNNRAKPGCLQMSFIDEAFQIINFFNGKNNLAIGRPFILR
jgi:hypothetical protein